MRIPKGPFQGATNGLLYALLIGGDCIDYREIPVLSGSATGLNPPIDAHYAMVILEADLEEEDPEVNKPAIRICECSGIQASSTTGMPVTHLSVIDVKGRKNMENFTASGIAEGKVHLLRVQFYG